MNLEKNIRNIFGHAIFAAAVIWMKLIFTKCMFIEI